MLEHDPQHSVLLHNAAVQTGNLVLKTGPLTVAILCSLGIHWKKKRQVTVTRVKENHNVMTLHQTLGLVILIHLNSTLFPSFLMDISKQNFNIEMFRIIFIENIFFKCLIPVLLLRRSRRDLRSLWANSQPRKISFFITPSSLIPRPVITRFHSTMTRESPEPGAIRYPNTHVTIVIHTSEADGREKPIARVD